MLFWLDFHQHNQTSTNDSECSGTTGLQWAQKNPCYTSLHLTALATSGSSHQVQDTDACIQKRPQAQHPPTSAHYYESTSPPEVWDLLVSDALWYHHREAQNHSPEHSHSPFLDGGIIFPPLSGMRIPVNLQATTENSSLSALLDFNPKLVLKDKKKKNLSLYLSLLPLLACTYLNNDWDLVLRALPLSDCLFKMNRFNVFSNCKSLWIKSVCQMTKCKCKCIYFLFFLFNFIVICQLVSCFCL